MITITRRLTLAALASTAFIGGPSFAQEKGLMTIIVGYPSNPYWKTEGDVAQKTAQDLGYRATVGAHEGDTNAESNLIDTAITNQSEAIILDPANADGSIGAVRKAVEAGIPVFLITRKLMKPVLQRHSWSPTMPNVRRTAR